MRKHWIRVLLVVAALIIALSPVAIAVAMTAVKDYPDRRPSPQALSIGITVTVTPDFSASAPTVVTVNATSITSSGATLSGNVTDTGGPNYDTRFVEWGTSSGNYTDNSTTSGSYSTGVFNIVLSTLSANTTYYWRPGAINTNNVGYGAESSFTTLEPSGAPDVPVGFTLERLSDMEILASWEAVSGNVTYLLLVSTTEYPDATDSNYAIAYNGSATSIRLVGYNIEWTPWYFSLWSHLNPYSETYATGTIGGEDMAEAITSLGEYVGTVSTTITSATNNILVLVIALAMMLGLAGLAYWKGDKPLFLVSGFGFMLYGFTYWTTSWQFSMLMVITGFFLIGRAFSKRVKL